MDVSPRALRAVTFRTSVRGYNVDDVDQFLERVAEGVAALQAKFDAAVARAEKAEADRALASEGEDAVQRTLVLAQRTADLALKEAKEEAGRLVADARATADRLATEAQQQLRADLDRLEAARKQLHADVLAMQQYVENERTRVRTALAELLHKVDNTTRRPPPPPTPSTPDIPPVVRQAASPAAEATEPEAAEPEADPVEAVAEVDEVAAEPELPPVRREPQPPPVAANPFTVARVGGRPSGPPPGPRRFAFEEASAAAPLDPGLEAAPQADDVTESEGGDRSSLRRLFGR